MYHDFASNNKRSGWVFTYMGTILESYARVKCEEYSKKLNEANKKMSILLMDRNTLSTSPEVTALRSQIERDGPIHEQLVVWVHEFQRDPNREFVLSVGDVVFFDIATEQINTERGTS